MNDDGTAQGPARREEALKSLSLINKNCKLTEELAEEKDWFAAKAEAYWFSEDRQQKFELGNAQPPALLTNNTEMVVEGTRGAGKVPCSSDTNEDEMVVVLQGGGRDIVFSEDDTTSNASGISHGLLQGSGGSLQQFMQEVNIISGPDEYVDDEGPSVQLVCGGSMTSYQQRLERRKAAMLDGICPGIDNKLLLCWFISCHFDKVYTLYFAFLRWRDIYLAEFPTAVVCVCDWPRANASESGNSQQSTNIGDMVADVALHLVQGTYYLPSVIHAQYVPEFGGYTSKMSASVGNTCTCALPKELGTSLSNVSTSYASSLTHQNHDNSYKDSGHGSELGGEEAD